ncbi:MAG TPA: Hsp70 family protein [Verrucomicrobiales bacterium]|nr:Hsp70 family protein [Verrucomicrobiales bacterium]
MNPRIGIDFGTSNTVMAVWDEVSREGVPFHLPDYGRHYQYNEEPVSVVPSVIHYAVDGVRWIGQQVSERQLSSSNRTFSLIKRYIGHRSLIKRRIDGREVSHRDAGCDFLSAVLLSTGSLHELEGAEVALTAPVESFEHYSDWISGVTEAAGISRIRLIDEPSAAALGYGANIQPGRVYMIFDFGGGTLDTAVVMIEEEDGLTSGRRCRILGKAGHDLGGLSVDTWLMKEVLRQNQLSEMDDSLRAISTELLLKCRNAKERLSTEKQALISLSHPENNRVLEYELTRENFEELLDQQEFYSQVDQTIRRSLNAARERGYSEDDVHSVLMVGGSSLIPSVQKTVQRIFGRDRVRQERPLDAVARGAASFVAGVDFFDHIQHEYAIRWLNSEKGDYDYLVIVKRGAEYPTLKPIARMTIKATYAGQKELGIAIFEISENRRQSAKAPLELVFDPTGSARLVETTAEEEYRRNYFWINEKKQTFLNAEPPATQGEKRFAIEFGIDRNKHLLVTARDLKTGHLVLHDIPVVKLT